MEEETLMHQVVEHIFHNWTALQLALNHCLPSNIGLQTFNEAVNYMTTYCVKGTNCQYDIAEALEDIMDQEFSTICEDNSIEEIASTLFRFSQLIKQQNQTQFEREFQKLPVGNQSTAGSNVFIDKDKSSCNLNNISDNSSDDDDVEDSKMAVDEEPPSEWTIVRSRKKR